MGTPRELFLIPAAHALPVPPPPAPWPGPQDAHWPPRSPPPPSDSVLPRSCPSLRGLGQFPCPRVGTPSLHMGALCSLLWRCPPPAPACPLGEPVSSQALEWDEPHTQGARPHPGHWACWPRCQRRVRGRGVARAVGGVLAVSLGAPPSPCPAPPLDQRGPAGWGLLPPGATSHPLHTLSRGCWGPLGRARVPGPSPLRLAPVGEQGSGWVALRGSPAEGQGPGRTSRTPPGGWWRGVLWGIASGRGRGSQALCPQPGAWHPRLPPSCPLCGWTSGSGLLCPGGPVPPRPPGWPLFPLLSHVPRGCLGVLWPLGRGRGLLVSWAGLRGPSPLGPPGQAGFGKDGRRGCFLLGHWPGEGAAASG